MARAQCTQVTKIIIKKKDNQNEGHQLYIYMCVKELTMKKPWEDIFR